MAIWFLKKRTYKNLISYKLFFTIQSFLFLDNLNRKSLSEDLKMAQEIENYLLEKLTKDIEETGEKDNKILAKFVPLQKQFTKLRNSLDDVARFPLGSARRREKLYYLNNEVCEWQLILKKHNLFTFVSQEIAYNSLRRRLKKVKEFRDGDKSVKAADSVNVSTQVDGVAVTSLLNDSETYRWSCRNPPSKVHGLEVKAKSLERQLLQRDSNVLFKAVGVVGVAGIGKTTLCQLIFNQQKVKEYFLPRIWVCLSKQPNENSDKKKETAKRILRCLGVEEDVIEDADTKRGLPGLIFALHLQLIGKRYLIVLDDASETDKFYQNLESGSNLNEQGGEELAYGLPKGWGGTVIVTSRAEEIAKKMVGEKNLSYLEPLSDPENCWQIFKDAVAKEENAFPQFLEDLKDKILKKCDGLPLAAKMLGQIAHKQLQDSPDVNENQQNGDHQESL